MQVGQLLSRLSIAICFSIWDWLVISMTVSLLWDIRGMKPKLGKGNDRAEVSRGYSTIGLWGHIMCAFSKDLSAFWCLSRDYILKVRAPSLKVGLHNNWIILYISACFRQLKVEQVFHLQALITMPVKMKEKGELHIYMRLSVPFHLFFIKKKWF